MPIKFSSNAARSFFFAFVLFFAADVVFAQSPVVFPVPELGNCASEEECRAYCEREENQDECRAFAEAHGIQIKVEGPGNCQGEAECRAFCDKPENRKECIDFAEKNGFLSHEDAERALKALELSEQGGPGGCKNETECRAYCADENHMDECLKFGVEHGFMSRGEAERARKLHSQTGPGGCRGQECKTYCEDPEHADACLEYASKQGLVSQGELERRKKFLRASEEGGPGGCRGISCRDYCSDPEHREECFKFAQEHDLISQEEKKEFERSRMLNTKVKEMGGPGGCQDEETCQAYCQDPAHVEECLGFATAHGGMTPEEAKEMLHRFIEMKNRFDRGPDFNSGETEERFGRFEEFEKMERQFRGDSQGRPEFFPGGSERAPFSGDMKGPGGCSSPEECMKYCLEHREECGLGGERGMNFSTPEPGRFSEIGRPGGPGGCASPEECAKYCQEHPDECKPPAGESFEHRAPEGFRVPDGFRQGDGTDFKPPEREFVPPENFQMPPTGEFIPSGDNFQRPPEEFQGNYESFPLPPEESSMPHIEPQPGALGILLAPFITILNLVR